MKLIYNKIIPFKGFWAINLFGVVFVRKQYGELPEIYKNHEAIHTAQMKELLYIPFYILYGAEYLYKLIKYFNSHKAYKEISFEKEANENENNLNYLKERKHYAQYRKRAA